MRTLSRVFRRVFPELCDCHPRSSTNMVKRSGLWGGAPLGDYRYYQPPVSGLPPTRRLVHSLRRSYEA